MDVREKLVEVLKKCGVCNTYAVVQLANALSENGVTVQEWIPVSVQKPEENKGVKVYDDGHMSLISVLVCGGNRGVNIANRFQIRPVGIPYLDEHATDGWEWSVGNEDITHWMPLPQPPKGE